MVEKVLGKTGATIKPQVIMYKAVVQAVLLYWREIWVLMDVMMMAI